MDMALVRQCGNRTTEMRMRAALARAGIAGYEVQAEDLPGRPDILFRGRLAVFTDGCFWHGCATHYRPPKTNALFWARKIKGNAERDKRNAGRLAALGYRVMHVWEHELRDAQLLRGVVLRVERALSTEDKSAATQYIERQPHSVPDGLLWCGPCFAATIHDIRKLTRQSVATCGKCKAQSVRVNGINVKQIGW